MPKSTDLRVWESPSYNVTCICGFIAKAASEIGTKDKLRLHYKIAHPDEKFKFVGMNFSFGDRTFNSNNPILNAYNDKVLYNEIQKKSTLI